MHTYGWARKVKTGKLQWVRPLIMPEREVYHFCTTDLLLLRWFDKHTATISFHSKSASHDTFIAVGQILTL